MKDMRAHEKLSKANPLYSGLLRVAGTSRNAPDVLILLPTL
jgi:hypothetical protein